MRIVVFVGSPLNNVDSAELVRLAKRLKKEKVSVDVVSFGEEKVRFLNIFETDRQWVLIKRFFHRGTTPCCPPLWRRLTGRTAFPRTC